MIPSRMMPRMMVTLNYENWSIAVVDVGDRRAHDADLHARGDLDLDVVVGVIGLGDLADDAARGHDTVAALGSPDHRLMLLLLLLLRADHEEPHHDEDEDQRHEKADIAHRAGGGGGAGRLR